MHKYWWSLFENLGLFYDSYEQFPTAIMVDEFGGNYLRVYKGSFHYFCGKICEVTLVITS